MTLNPTWVTVIVIAVFIWFALGILTFRFTRIGGMVAMVTHDVPAVGLVLFAAGILLGPLQYPVYHFVCFIIGLFQSLHWRRQKERRQKEIIIMRDEIFEELKKNGERAIPKDIQDRMNVLGSMVRHFRKDYPKEKK